MHFFFYKMVYYGKWDWYTVGFVWQVYSVYILEEFLEKYLVQSKLWMQIRLIVDFQMIWNFYSSSNIVNEIIISF